MTAVAHFGCRIARLFGIYAGLAASAAGVLFVSYQIIVVTELTYRNASGFLADSGLSLRGVVDGIVLFELLAGVVIGYFLHQRSNKYKISAIGSVVVSVAAICSIADFILRFSPEVNDKGDAVIVAIFVLLQVPALFILYMMTRWLIFEEPLSRSDETTKEKSDTF
jgi:hypothetical protein